MTFFKGTPKSKFSVKELVERFKEGRTQSLGAKVRYIVFKRFYVYQNLTEADCSDVLC